jgi:hypothetical protein
MDSMCRAHNASSARALTQIQGKAATIYDGKKTKTCSDQANFVPFIERGRPALPFQDPSVGSRGHG